MDSSRQAGDHFGVQRSFELPAVTLAVVNIEDDLGTTAGQLVSRSSWLVYNKMGDNALRSI